MAQGGRAQGSYDGVGWLEGGTYSISGTEAEGRAEQPRSSGSFVDADGVLGPASASSFAPEGRGSLDDADLFLGVVDPGAASAVAPSASRSELRRDHRSERRFRAGSDPPGLQPGKSAGRNQSTPDAIDAILELDLTVCSRIRSW